MPNKLRHRRNRDPKFECQTAKALRAIFENDEGETTKVKSPFDDTYY